MTHNDCAEVLWLRSLTMLDIAARSPVWQALSELFLDTDLLYQFEGAIGPPAIEYVARTLASSPYSVEALREIELWEVAPVVMPRPYDVAPEWAGFNTQWLEEHCARRARHRGWLLRQRVRFGFAQHVRRFTDDYWRYLTPRIAELRAGADSAGV